jgi:hypothetical protein
LRLTLGEIVKKYRDDKAPDNLRSGTPTGRRAEGLRSSSGRRRYRESRACPVPRFHLRPHPFFRRFRSKRNSIFVCSCKDGHRQVRVAWKATSPGSAGAGAFASAYDGLTFIGECRNGTTHVGDGARARRARAYEVAPEETRPAIAPQFLVCPPAAHPLRSAMLRRRRVV